jgi:hypothetical protein
VTHHAQTSCHLARFAAMGGSNDINYYAKLATMLAMDNQFLSLLEVATSYETKQEVAECLAACLKSIGAPETMAAHGQIFSNFAAFCRNPAFQDSMPKGIQDALRARRLKINTDARLGRLMCFKAGLNWKSPLQSVRRENRLARIPVWVAIDLGEPYPPLGKWVTENNEIFQLWDPYLKNPKRKVHDKWTPKYLIHKLDPDMLIHNIRPDMESIFADDGVPFLASLIRFYSFQLLDELIGVVLRNFCRYPKLLEFVNRVIQLNIEIKRNARISSTLCLVAQLA